MVMLAFQFLFSVQFFLCVCVCVESMFCPLGRFSGGQALYRGGSRCLCRDNTYVGYLWLLDEHDGRSSRTGRPL